MKLKSLSILITGASTGIGFATALSLAEDGHQVFAGVRRAQDGDLLKEAHPEIIPVILDVTNPEHIATAQEFIRSQRHNRPFCLINNAGTAVYGPIEAVSVDEFKKQFEVNVFGVVAVTKAFLPFIRETQGRIVNISSVSGRIASPFLGPYAASKFALEGLSDSLRRELLPFGVKVILIEPGPIETPIWKKGLNTKDENTAKMDSKILEVYQKYIQFFEEEVRQAVETADPVGYVVDTIKAGLYSYSPQHRYMVGRQASIGGLISQFIPSKAVDLVIRKRLMHLK